MWHLQVVHMPEDCNLLALNFFWHAWIVGVDFKPLAYHVCHKPFIENQYQSWAAVERLFRVTYSTDLPFSYITWFLYIWGEIFTISSANLSRSAIFASLSISALRKAPGMLHIPTLVTSCASIVSMISTDSVETVGGVVSLGTDFLRCFWPSTHGQPFTLPSLLTFKNIRDLSVLHFWYLVRCLSDYGKNYSSCGDETDPLLPPSPPFPQFSSACASGSIALIHMQSLLHSQFSTQNIIFLRASRTTMHPCLGHYQLVRTTLINQYFPSHIQFASAGGDCIHSSPLVA